MLHLWGAFVCPSLDRCNLIHTNAHGQLLTKLLPAFLTLELKEILGFSLSLFCFSISPFPSLADLSQIRKWPKENMQNPIKPT